MGPRALQFSLLCLLIVAEIVAADPPWKNKRDLCDSYVQCGDKMLEVHERLKNAVAVLEGALTNNDHELLRTMTIQSYEHATQLEELVTFAMRRLLQVPEFMLEIGGEEVEMYVFEDPLLSDDIRDDDVNGEQSARHLISQIERGMEQSKVLNDVIIERMQRSGISEDEMDAQLDRVWDELLARAESMSLKSYADGAVTRAGIRGDEAMGGGHQYHVDIDSTATADASTGERARHAPHDDSSWTGPESSSGEAQDLSEEEMIEREDLYFSQITSHHILLSLLDPLYDYIEDVYAAMEMQIEERDERMTRGRANALHDEPEHALSLMRVGHQEARGIVAKAEQMIYEIVYYSADEEELEKRPEYMRGRISDPLDILFGAFEGGEGYSEAEIMAAFEELLNDERFRHKVNIKTVSMDFASLLEFNATDSAHMLDEDFDREGEDDEIVL